MWYLSAFIYSFITANIALHTQHLDTLAVPYQPYQVTFFPFSVPGYQRKNTVHE